VAGLDESKVFWASLEDDPTYVHEVTGPACHVAL